MKYVVNNTDEQIVEINDLEDLVKSLVKDFDIEDSIFSVIITGDKEIRELNKTYRHIDKETDVISFALEDDQSFQIEIRVLGDIYISLDRAKNQAKEYKHSLKRELSFLTVHGLLHLLAYDHMTEEDEKIMFNLQKEVLDKYEIQRT